MATSKELPARLQRDPICQRTALIAPNHDLFAIRPYVARVAADMLWMILSCPTRNLGIHHGNRFSEHFRPLAGIKYAQSAIELRAKRRANHLYPLRDGSEKAEGFPRGARETMVARYKRRQLGVSGWPVRRKALGFFGHVVWQASGWRETRLHQATQK